MILNTPLLDLLPYLKKKLFNRNFSFKVAIRVLVWNIILNVLENVYYADEFSRVHIKERRSIKYAQVLVTVQKQNWFRVLLLVLVLDKQFAVPVT